MYFIFLSPKRFVKKNKTVNNSVNKKNSYPKKKNDLSGFQALVFTKSKIN